MFFIYVIDVIFCHNIYKLKILLIFSDLSYYIRVFETWKKSRLARKAEKDRKDRLEKLSSENIKILNEAEKASYMYIAKKQARRVNV